MDRLKTQIAGLTTAEFQSRLAIYGPNNASDVKATPLWRQFLVRFENPLIIILLIASGVSALTGGLASFVVIVVIVMISVVFDFVQDVRAQNAVASLRASVAVQATVRRDGKPSQFRSTNWSPATSSNWPPAISFLRTPVCSRAGTSMSIRRC